VCAALLASKMILYLVLLFCCLNVAGGVWVKEMENKGAFQGDMILDPDELENGWNVSRSTYGPSTFASIKGGRWPGAVVPYQIQSSIGASGVAAIRRAIADYHRYTCIRWVPRTNQRTYVSFYRGGGCSSPVGYRNGRVNYISLASGCWSKGITMHEMGHSLGLYHEQSRPDRDSYVNIIWRNIPTNIQYNFNKLTTAVVNSLGTPYDYNSMMHYGATAFGGGRMTIQTKDPSKQNVIGRFNGFSQTDIRQLKLMYKCGTFPNTVKPPTQTCVDKSSSCSTWARAGYCTVNAAWESYMKANCCKACKGQGGTRPCTDLNQHCAYHASRGYCNSSRYGQWMATNCKRSCRKC